MKKKQQWWHTYALVAGLFALVTLLGFMVLNTFIWPDYTSREEAAETQKVALQEKIEDARRADTLIQQLTDQITLLIGGNGAEKGKLDKAIDMPDMLNQMEYASSQSGLRIKSYNIGGTGAYFKRPSVATVVTSEGAVNIYNVSLEIALESSYDALQEFVRLFEETGYYVTVDTVTIDRIDNNINKKFEGTLKLVVYSTTSGGVTESIGTTPVNDNTDVVIDNVVTDNVVEDNVTEVSTIEAEKENNITEEVDTVITNETNAEENKAVDENTVSTDNASGNILNG